MTDEPNTTGEWQHEFLEDVILAVSIRRAAKRKNVPLSTAEADAIFATAQRVLGRAPISDNDWQAIYDRKQLIEDELDLCEMSRAIRQQADALGRAALGPI